jgi:hypothetical protein
LHVKIQAEGQAWPVCNRGAWRLRQEDLQFKANNNKKTIQAQGVTDLEEMRALSV